VLRTDDGEAVHIRAFALLASRNIVEARVVTAPDGRPAVEATLDQSGRMRWLQVCAEHAGDRVAVAVDGFYRFAMRMPPPSSASDTVLVSGGWGAKEAETVAAWASHNYGIFNSK